MSRENVEIVRRALAAANAEELDWDILNSLYHRDHVFVPATAGLGDGEVTGASGFSQWFEQARSVTDWENEIHGLLDMGPHVVMAEVSVHFRGLGSGAGGEQQMWMVMELTGGKIKQTRVFLKPHEAALEAARLSQ